MPLIPRFVPKTGGVRRTRSGGRRSPTMGRPSVDLRGRPVPAALSMRRSKALSVSSRTHAQASLKEAAKNFGAGEAAMPGDSLNLILAIFESAARRIEAGAFHEHAGRCARFPLEVTHEVARTHMHALSKRLDRQITGQVVENPALQFADRTVAIKLGC